MACRTGRHYFKTRTRNPAEWGRPWSLVVTDLEGHPRSMTFYVIWKRVCYFILVIINLKSYYIAPFGH